MKIHAGKILSSVLVLIMVLGFSSLSFAAGNGVLTGGDSPTAADARAILRAAVGLDSLTPEEEIAADIDMDGAVTSSDARLALRIAVGLEAVDGKLYFNEYEVLRSGHFYAEMDASDAEGNNTIRIGLTDSTLYFGFAMESAELTMDMTFLTRGGSVYLLDEAGAQYAPVSSEVFSELEDFGFALNDLEEEAKSFSLLPPLDEADAKTFAFYGDKRCDVYSFYEEDGSMRIYMDGKKLVAISSFDADNRLIDATSFSCVTLTVPAEKTNVPASYKAADVFELMASVLFGSFDDE